eukprot:m.264894 g.264894  ORF g.264894 m.264894 type:complete len:528 (-) comp58785_c0_seq1:61-1644(-)
MQTNAYVDDVVNKNSLAGVNGVEKTFAAADDFEFLILDSDDDIDEDNTCRSRLNQSGDRCFSNPLQIAKKTAVNHPRTPLTLKRPKHKPPQAPISHPDCKHVHLDAMNVSKFFIHTQSQRLLVKLQMCLLDEPYKRFGKTEGSWDTYNVVFPSSFGSDRRKPVTAAFQQYCDALYCPIMYTLIFGKDGWQKFQKHLSSFKSNTIKVCETTAFHGENIFHMHLDGRIGKLQPKNFQEKHSSRFLFSIVPHVLNTDPEQETLLIGMSSNTCASGHVSESNDHSMAPLECCSTKMQKGSAPSIEIIHTEKERATRDLQCDPSVLKYNPTDVKCDLTISDNSVEKYTGDGCSIYPLLQPVHGFYNNNEFHRYMEAKYHECALSKGFPRPLYAIPEHLVYRATTGEVLVHKSHAEPNFPQPIHAEANPCPDRYLFVFDFQNIINRDSNGKISPSTEIPEHAILEHMRVLQDHTSPVYRKRLQEVCETANVLLNTVNELIEQEHQDLARVSLNIVLASISHALSHSIEIEEKC